MQARRKRGPGGALAKQLTLSQPGGQIMEFYRVEVAYRVWVCSVALNQKQ